MALTSISLHQLAYAVNPFGRSVCLTATTTYLMYFYTDVVLLSAALVGLALGLGRVWDAINDPIMGYVSDHTRTRWGRRRPWILGAALPYAACFVLLFRPPAFETQLALFAWLLVVSLLLDSFDTAMEMPSAALGVELETDYDARTRLFALRDFFSYAGMICGGFFPLLVATRDEPRTGYARVAMLFAAAAAITTLAVVFVPERAGVPHGRTAGLADFWNSLKQCLRGRSFRILLATFFVASAGLGIGVAAGVYALIYWLQFTPAQVGLLLPVHLGCCALALPFWVWLSKRVGKTAAIRAWLLYEAAVMVALYFMWPWKPIVYLGTIISGIGTAGIVNVTSLLADVIDEDELVTGSQRAGAFIGFWTVAMKGAAATGPVIVGAALTAAGLCRRRRAAPDRHHHHPLALRSEPRRGVRARLAGVSPLRADARAPRRDPGGARGSASRRSGSIARS